MCRVTSLKSDYDKMRSVFFCFAFTYFCGCDIYSFEPKITPLQKSKLKVKKIGFVRMKDRFRWCVVCAYGLKITLNWFAEKNLAN